MLVLYSSSPIHNDAFIIRVFENDIFLNACRTYNKNNNNKNNTLATLMYTYCSLCWLSPAYLEVD